MENEKMIQGERISENITLCPDGKYRWVYEMNLFKNYTIYFIIWKIFFFIILGMTCIGIIADAIQWREEFSERLLGNLKFCGIFLIGMTVVTFLGYAVYALMNGKKYCVMFEMDEEGVNHKQMPKQAEKAELISAITVLAGLAAGNITTVGIGLNSARTEMYSEFAKVRKVKANRLTEVIKVNGLLSHNQVYAEKEDFDFVLDYIKQHCTNTK